MLRLGAEAVMLERDGGGALEVSLGGQTRWDRTGTRGNRGRLRQKTGLLVLFGVGRQSYSTYEMRADGLPIWGMSVKICACPTGTSWTIRAMWTSLAGRRRGTKRPPGRRCPYGWLAVRMERFGAP